MRRHAEAAAELATLEDRWLALDEQRAALERDGRPAS
jgi:hypothetical protein